MLSPMIARRFEKLPVQLYSELANDHCDVTLPANDGLDVDATHLHVIETANGAAWPIPAGRLPS